MNNNKVVKILFIAMMIALILGVTGFTYGYFGLEIEGTPRDIVMETGDLKLTYIDDTELQLTEAMPGDSVSKKIKVTNNNSKELSYNLYWGELINTIDYFELHVTLDCKSYINYGETNQQESGTCDSIYKAVPISDTVTDGNIKKNITIAGNTTHEYTVTVTFDNKTYPQDENIGKKFTGKIGIEQYIEPEEIYCTYDGTLTQGTEFVNGPYVYRYKSRGKYNYSGLAWDTTSEDGWGVQLKDRNSTDAVTEAPCTYINDKPIISYGALFVKSKASSIDVSSFNTKYITDMRDMFHYTDTTEIIGFEEFDTSKVTDMSSMFNMVKIKSLDLSGYDTSKVTNMSGMFYQLDAKLDVSSFDTSNVIDMHSMFTYVKSNKIDLSNFDTSNVINMESMFSQGSIDSLDLSNFNTGNVTNMYMMFSYFKSNELNLSSFDTSKVTTMYRMFYGASSLKNLIGLDKFDTSNVTNMAGMFYNLELNVIDVSNFNTSKVTDMSEMFHSCSSVNVIDVSNFDTSKVNYMSFMFYGVKANLDLSKWNTSNVITMSYMFYNTKMPIIDVSNFNTSKVTNMSGMFKQAGAEKIKGLEKFDTSNVTNMSEMFHLTNASLIDLSNFNTSKVTNMSYMLGAKKDVIGYEKFDTSKVTDMSWMFTGSSLNTIDVSNFDTSSVTNMSGLFSDISGKVVGLNKFNTSKVTNMSSMFQGTKNAFDLSSFDTSNVTNMERMFYESKIDKMEYINKLNTSNVTNMRLMFHMTYFIELDLSNFDTSKVTDMSSMFSYSKKLKTIYVGNGFVTNNVTNSNSMFHEMSDLTGSSGTSWSSSNPKDKTYARVDGGTSSPGYFTLKSN